MELVCSRCHTHFESESAHGAHCPTCGAEAGLEVEHGGNFSIRAFGSLLGVCVTMAVVSVLLVFLGNS